MQYATGHMMVHFHIFNVMIVLQTALVGGGGEMYAVCT